MKCARCNAKNAKAGLYCKSCVKKLDPASSGCSKSCTPMFHAYDCIVAHGPTEIVLRKLLVRWMASHPDQSDLYADTHRALGLDKVPAKHKRKDRLIDPL